MNLTSRRTTDAAGIGKIWWMPIAVLAFLAPAHGQVGIDITPLIGLKTGGGSIDLEEQGQPGRATARLSDGLTFGVAAGYRFFDEEGCDDCSVVEFRWMRQNTNLAFKDTAGLPTPLAVTFGRTAVTLDHYLFDLTHEWNLGQC